MYAFLRIYLHLPQIWHQEIQIHPYIYMKKELSLGEGMERETFQSLPGTAK